MNPVNPGSALPRLSTYAGNIDLLIIAIAVMVFFWFFIAQGAMFWMIFKFKAKDGQKAQYITGEKKEEKRWITIPHNIILVCDFAIIVGAIMVWYNVKQQLPEPDRTVRVIAQQWAWTFVHPGPDGKIDTTDDIKTADTLFIEKDKNYHYKLTSRDVLHSFSVPVFRLKQDAIPGREITGWFKATGTGTHDIQCAEMCGIGHGLMPAQIVIQDEATHRAWAAKWAGKVAPTMLPIGLQRGTNAQGLTVEATDPAWPE
jgi:cytochrome c oxidase subunit 2